MKLTLIAAAVKAICAQTRLEYLEAMLDAPQNPSPSV